MNVNPVLNSRVHSPTAINTVLICNCPSSFQNMDELVELFIWTIYHGSSWRRTCIRHASDMGGGGAGGGRGGRARALLIYLMISLFVCKYVHVCIPLPVGARGDHFPAQSEALCGSVQLPWARWPLPLHPQHCGHTTSPWQQYCRCTLHSMCSAPFQCLLLFYYCFHVCLYMKYKTSTVR